jgi:DNA-directed RNA polymerase specialized sigma24 family protein
MCDDNNLHDLEFQKLIFQACESPRRSFQRRQSLSQIVRRVNECGRLWRENSADYREALQNMWLYVCEHPEKYSPERGSVINWLNTILKYRLLDVHQEKKIEQRWLLAPSPQLIETRDNPIENIPAPAEIPPILEKTRQWIETDPQDKLRSAHIRGRPDLNCQILLLRRFPPETHWDMIAEEFEVSQSVAPMFYTRKCLPLLRQFGVDEGYL